MKSVNAVAMANHSIHCCFTQSNHTAAGCFTPADSGAGFEDGFRLPEAVKAYRRSRKQLRAAQMGASGNNVALVISYIGDKSLESFKIYLPSPTQGV